MARNYVALPANRAAQAVPCVGCGTSVIPSPSARPYEGDGLIALDHHPLRVGLEAAYCPDPGDANDNGDCPVIYGTKFCMFAGDSGAELKVHLRTVRCKEGEFEDDPSTWEPLNINGYKFITLYLRNRTTRDHFMSIYGYPITPMRNGNVVFRMPDHIFDCVSGEYEGEVEVEYWTGRIVTAIEKVLMEVHEDFSGHGESNMHPNCTATPEHLPSFPDEFPTQLPVDDALQIEHMKTRYARMLAPAAVEVMTAENSARIARMRRVAGIS